MRLDGEGLRGELVAPDGKRYAYSASRVASDGVPGLYDAIDDRGTTGLIVAPGDVAQGAFVSREGIFAQVNPFRPIVLEGTGIRVSVALIKRELLVLRVHV
jgi:hypothetical protein